MTYGVDLSTIGQPTVDIATLSQHIEFAFIKATEGITFTDPNYAARVAELVSYKVPTIPYHFAHPEIDHPADEAKHFLTVAGPQIDATGRYALDLEKGYGQPTVGANDLTEWCAAFAQAITDAKGILYTNTTYLAQLNWSVLIPYFDLWLANPGVSEPAVKGATFWQYGQSTIPGAGLVDLDRYYGPAPIGQYCTSQTVPPADPSPAGGTPPTTTTATEEDNMALIVADPNGPAQYVVRTDLTSKVWIESEAELNSLFATGMYKRATLDAATLSGVPLAGPTPPAA